MNGSFQIQKLQRKCLLLASDFHQHNHHQPSSHPKPRTHRCGSSLRHHRITVFDFLIELPCIVNFNTHTHTARMSGFLDDDEDSRRPTESPSPPVVPADTKEDPVSSYFDDAYFGDDLSTGLDAKIDGLDGSSNKQPANSSQAFDKLSNDARFHDPSFNATEFFEKKEWEKEDSTNVGEKELEVSGNPTDEDNSGTAEPFEMPDAEAASSHNVGNGVAEVTADSNAEGSSTCTPFQPQQPAFNDQLATARAFIDPASSHFSTHGSTLPQQMSATGTQLYNLQTSASSPYLIHANPQLLPRGGVWHVPNQSYPQHPSDFQRNITATTEPGIPQVTPLQSHSQALLQSHEATQLPRTIRSSVSLPTENPLVLDPRLRGDNHSVAGNLASQSSPVQEAVSENTSITAPTRNSTMASGNSNERITPRSDQVTPATATDESPNIPKVDSSEKPENAGTQVTANDQPTQAKKKRSSTTNKGKIVSPRSQINVKELLITDMETARDNAIKLIPLKVEHDDRDDVAAHREHWIPLIAAALDESFEAEPPKAEDRKTPAHLVQWTQWQTENENKTWVVLSAHPNPPILAQSCAYIFYDMVLEAHRPGKGLKDVCKTISNGGPNLELKCSERIEKAINALEKYPIVRLDLVKLERLHGLLASPDGFVTRKIDNMWQNSSRKYKKLAQEKADGEEGGAGAKGKGKKRKAAEVSDDSIESAAPGPKKKKLDAASKSKKSAEGGAQSKQGDKERNSADADDEHSEQAASSSPLKRKAAEADDDEELPSSPLAKKLKTIAVSTEEDAEEANRGLTIPGRTSQ